MGDFNPYIYKTTDFGNTWIMISNSLPKSNASFVHQVKEDPAEKGLLWVGTDNALYFSLDDGAHWNHLKNNLPPSPIYGIAIQENFKDLILATYGRGFYILDDISPIRNLSDEVRQSPVHLFGLRNGYRFIKNSGIHTSERNLVTGQNPPYGSDINYYLASKQVDRVLISVVDELGNKVREMKGTGNSGINRIWWDLPRLTRVPCGVHSFSQHFICL